MGREKEMKNIIDFILYCLLFDMIKSKNMMWKITLKTFFYPINLYSKIHIEGER